MKRLGVFVDFFDPLNKGHIGIAKDAMHFLDAVYFAPLTYGAVLSLKNRQDLLSCCIEPPFCILPEQKSEGKNSCAAYISRLKELNPDSSIFLLLSMETLELIKDIPLMPEHILKGLIVYHKVGHSTQKVLQSSQERGARSIFLAHRIFFRSAENLPSSAMVRRHIKELDDVPEWVPDAVMYKIAREGLYLPDYAEALEDALSPARLKHSISVRETAVALAYRYKAPMLKTSVASILHDCAKCMPFSQMQNIARDNRLTEDSELLSSPALLHGLVGAYIAKTVYGIDDSDVLNAITYHTVGRPGMTDTELCVFLADSIEPLRGNYPGVDKLREIAQQDLKTAALECLKLTKKHVLSKGGRYYQKAQDAMDDLERRLS